MSKAIIDTEFISIVHAKENVIYAAAILVQDENGKEVYAETLKPHTYRFGLKLANTPKYQPARGKVKIKYLNKSNKGKNLTSLQLLIRKPQQRFNISYWFCKGPNQTDLLLIENVDHLKFVIKSKKIKIVSSTKEYTTP